MAIYKCKMCGGSLNVNEGDKVVECEYCSTTQTISTSNDDKILKLFARGNALRTEGEFDKAYNVFEQIIAESADAEAYWNLLLCKYGITYVDDYNGKKKPTMNRMSMDSILEDNDYNKVLELSDVITKDTYKKEANEISKIQDRIIKIVRNENPYDIFISYKETDEFGDRTKDSILAQEIYDTLTKEGYKVFLSRVTLSSIAGQEYEPYIYSALYSSKMMILVTTSVDYVNAVWVKNEWTRFLGMMKNDSNKNIVPCYKDIDAYDLPKELRSIQGLDMSKLGFIQDLVVGVNKVFGKSEAKKVVEVKKVVVNGVNISGLLKRSEMLINDGDYESAQDKIEEVLDNDPENAKAYELLFIMDYENDLKGLREGNYFIQDNDNYKKILMYGDEKTKQKYIKFKTEYDNRIVEKAQTLKENLQSKTENKYKDISIIKEMIKELIDVNTAESDNLIEWFKNKIECIRYEFSNIIQHKPLYFNYDDNYNDRMYNNRRIEFDFSSDCIYIYDCAVMYHFSEYKNYEIIEKYIEKINSLGDGVMAKVKFTYDISKIEKIIFGGLGTGIYCDGNKHYFPKESKCNNLVMSENYNILKEMSKYFDFNVVWDQSDKIEYDKKNRKAMFKVFGWIFFVIFIIILFASC